MSEWKSITLPLTDTDISLLRAGDMVYLQGQIYTARDKAHERLYQLYCEKRPMPFECAGQIIYYSGPSPAPPGRIIGSAGPTTSYRMDDFTDFILSLGIKGMIGKGSRNIETRGLLQKNNAVYFSSFGGAAAYISERILSCELIAFEDLGPEAVYRFTVKDFPVIVINDTQGNDLYENNLG